MNELTIERPREIDGLTPRLPASLRRAIDEAEFDHGNRIAKVPSSITDTDLMGLTAAIHSAEASLAPATTAQRRACLLALATVYPARAGDEETQTARFEIYHEALRDIPGDVLWNACMDCVKTQKFFPMPAEIRTIADRLLGGRRTILARLRALRDYRTVRPEAEDDVSAAELEHRKKIVREARRSLTESGVIPEDKIEERLRAAVITVTAEPEVSDLATAILRARITANGAGELDMGFLKQMALADASRVWPWLKARGWRALQAEGTDA